MGLECSALKSMVLRSNDKKCKQQLHGSLQYLKSIGAEGSTDGAVAPADLSLSYIDSESPAKDKSDTPKKKPLDSPPPPPLIKSSKSPSVRLTYSPSTQSTGVGESAVFVAGSFNGWSADADQMKYDVDAKCYVLDVLPEEEKVEMKTKKIEFKFVVDGVWMAAAHYDTCDDGMGGRNNCIAC